MNWNLPVVEHKGHKHRPDRQHRKGHTHTCTYQRRALPLTHCSHHSSKVGLPLLLILILGVPDQICVDWLALIVAFQSVQLNNGITFMYYSPNTSHRTNILHSFNETLMNKHSLYIYWHLYVMLDLFRQTKKIFNMLKYFNLSLKRLLLVLMATRCHCTWFLWSTKACNLCLA